MRLSIEAIFHKYLQQYLLMENDVLVCRLKIWKQLLWCICLEDCRQIPISKFCPSCSRLICQLFCCLLFQKIFCVIVRLAIVRLHEGGCTNILYSLAKGIGTSRPDGSDALFPIKQIAMGSVEYIALFFVTDNLQKVQIFYYNMCLIF